MIRLGYIVLIIATLVAGANAFVAPPLPKAAPTARIRTEHFSDETTGFDSFQRMRRPIKDISYGEDSRKYRRTVYSHDDWKLHRSQDRFVYYLAAIFKSGV